MRVRHRLLTDVLRPVSRAFYLTIRVLPGSMREVVGLAYLLARTADTVADTEALEPGQRRAWLAQFRARLHDDSTPLETPRLDQPRPEERALFEVLPDSLRLYDTTVSRDRLSIQKVVDTLVSGMQWDLEFFEGADEPRALPKEQDLERYIYLVAGCVGEFWTVISRRHTLAFRNREEAEVVDLGVRFGKALQLTNVLRDLPRDLRQGRCYLPAEELRELEPAQLLDPDRLGQLEPILSKWLTRAGDYYQAAVDYTCAIPVYCLRLRLAALWPILIGLATLGKLNRTGAWLEPNEVVKVSRKWVYAMLVWSLPLALFSPLLRAVTQSMRARLKPS